jgi:hypothetical protein
MRSALFAAVVALSITSPSRIEAGEARCGGEHLTIQARHDPGTGVSGSWTLTLEPTGIGKVKTDSGNVYPLRLSSSDCRNFVAVVRAAHFLDLKDSYGESYVETPFRDLEIALGSKRHSVTLFDRIDRDADRSGVKRAVRVWIAVRSLFTAPDAADSREKDRALLRAPQTNSQ